MGILYIAIDVERYSSQTEIHYMLLHFFVCTVIEPFIGVYLT